MSYELRVKSLKTRVEKVPVQIQFKSASSNPRVTSLNPPVTSSSLRVTSSNPRVTSSNLQVTSSKPRVTLWKCCFHFKFLLEIVKIRSGVINFAS